MYCTADSEQTAIFNMLETAITQAEEQKYMKSKKLKDAKEPIYTDSEVENCSQLFATFKPHKKVLIDKNVAVNFFKAGHSPGSVFVKISFSEGKNIKKVLYIGDLGADENDLYAKPVISDSYDGLLLPACKAGEGDAKKTEKKLAQIINQTFKAGGNILIPASSIDRRDAILRLIRDLFSSGQIPRLFVFIDSAIASKQYQALPFDTTDTAKYPCIQLFDTVADSKCLNLIKGTAIIIAGSGKAGYGRILFHLKRNIARKECAIVLFGKQPDMLKLGGCRKTLSILGEKVQVKAKICRIEDPSVHLDSSAVARWLNKIKSIPQHIYITHGTPEAKAEFKKKLQHCGIKNVYVPSAGEKVTL